MIDQTRSSAHQIFDQYRSTVAIIIGLGTLYHLSSRDNRYSFSSPLMVIQPISYQSAVLFE